MELPPDEPTTKRFNLVIEILMVDRYADGGLKDLTRSSFNLVIEILMVDRGIRGSYPWAQVWFQSRNRDSYG